MGFPTKMGVLGVPPFEETPIYTRGSSDRMVTFCCLVVYPPPTQQICLRSTTHTHTLPKNNIEPEHHLIEKEMHLPNAKLHFKFLKVNFSGCIYVIAKSIIAIPNLTAQVVSTCSKQ